MKKSSIDGMYYFELFELEEHAEKIAAYLAEHLDLSFKKKEKIREKIIKILTK